MVPRLLSVQTGRIAPLGPQAADSGIVKHARSGRIAVGPLGLEGDEQADRAVHGGAYKAVYGFSVDHFPAWSARFAQIPFANGAMGENLSIAGMTENDICVGDVHTIGTALLQVCQPRQPCFKLDLLHNAQLSNQMISSFQSGWYYTVLKPGSLAAGDTIALHARPNPDFPFSRLVEIVYRKRGAPADLARMADMEGLAPKWRERARLWLESATGA